MENTKDLIQVELDRLAAERDKTVAEIGRINALRYMYSDLSFYTDRLGLKMWCTKSINGSVSDFEHRFGCGCCPDSVLEVYPYLDTKHGRVHSDPPIFPVGRDSHNGLVPNRGWEGRLGKAGIPEAIIGKVGLLFEEAREARRKELEEELAELDSDQESG